jgi:hypothetical protein
MEKIQIDKKLFKQQIEDGFTISELQKYWNCTRTVITERKKTWEFVGLSPNSKPRDNGDGTKRCNKCFENKPLSDFYSNGYAPKGVPRIKPSCKVCENAIRNIGYVKFITSILHEMNREYKCEVCGYDENYSALCFHHVTDEKNFQISDPAAKGSRDREKFKHELSICAVLCQNCHHRIHNPTWDRDVFFQGL